MDKCYRRFVVVLMIYCSYEYYYTFVIQTAEAATILIL